MIYRVAGQPLRVAAEDAWAARVTAALFAEWYMDADGEGAAEPSSTPAILVRSAAPVPRIPAGLPAFAIAGGGTCHTDGGASYIDIDGSMVAIGGPGLADVEVWMNGPLALDSPAVTRLVSYALSAALRRRALFELHSAALVDPQSGAGVLIIGPSGSGKSTQTVHLAAAGWPFLTDDVLLLGQAGAGIQAWPLRRCFAITSETFAASRFLQTRTSFDPVAVQEDDKRLFVPHGVFTAGFRDSCVPGTLVFPELSGGSRSRVSRLSAGEAMARLIRISPWSCYDRATAAGHLAVLSTLAQQAGAYALQAGTDLLDAQASTDLIAGCAAGAWA
jgi:ABC-type uncharacterized transport system YnjBCD ATPase subunit